jgi:aspartyl-tRNA(Asn)/glutamyl-tRNA(Gln) amidotransferase subunit A
MSLWQMPAGQAVRAMQKGQLAPEEYVCSHLERIEATEPRVGAWEQLDRDAALSQARAAQLLPPDERANRPLFGLPVGVKDVIDVAGFATTANFEPYRSISVASDATVVARLRLAGAIVLGKTTTTQFAWGQDSTKTRNPWNVDHTPGGSSSGSPAAVAAGHIQIGVGTQTASSLLRPSSYCGVVGLKPSYGRVSCAGVLSTSWTSDHPGFVARSVRDVAAAMQATAGYDPPDPHSVCLPGDPYVDAAETPLRPRLGVLRDYVERSNTDVRQGFDSAISRLAAMGADLVEIKLPVDLDVILAVHWVTSNSEAASNHAEQFARHSEYYLPTVRANFEVAHLIPSMAYLQARRVHRKIRPLMRTMFDDVDAIVAPTSSDMAPRVDNSALKPLGDTTLQIASSAFGYPGITLPTGLAPNNLPYALQLFSPPYSEIALLRAAAWCEQALPPIGMPEINCE